MVVINGIFYIVLAKLIFEPFFYDFFHHQVVVWQFNFMVAKLYSYRNRLPYNRLGKIF